MAPYTCCAHAGGMKGRQQPWHVQKWNPSSAIHATMHARHEENGYAHRRRDKPTSCALDCTLPARTRQCNAIDARNQLQPNTQQIYQKPRFRPRFTSSFQNTSWQQSRGHKNPNPEAPRVAPLACAEHRPHQQQCTGFHARLKPTTGCETLTSAHTQQILLFRLHLLPAARRRACRNRTWACWVLVPL